jgi:hypothetical protein
MTLLTPALVVDLDAVAHRHANRNAVGAGLGGTNDREPDNAAGDRGARQWSGR